MSRDFLVSIRPDAPNPVRVVVLPAGGNEVNLERGEPSINDADMDALRNGAPPSDARDRVVDGVTAWFLDKELRNVLQPAVDNQPFRLVISTDHKVEAKFANVPFELTRWSNVDYLLTLKNLVGLVYAPPTTPTAFAPAAQTATFRVLLIRAEPAHMAGTVPSGTALRDELRAAVPAAPPRAIDIRLLSREDGADGPPTWASIQSEVNARPPAIVLYLGHGDLLPGAGGAPASPVLLIERADGEQDELTTLSLRQLFKKQPVPLVVLAGCLTAAAGATTVRFGQSMAQSLVSGEGGVTVAIGMRYRIDVADCTAFLRQMLAGLFDGTPGNVDLAVQAARTMLFANKPNELGWAAPMVYRRMTTEPLFPELRAQPPVIPPAPPAAPGVVPQPGPGPAAPVIPPSPDDDAARQQLSIIWSALAGLPADRPASLLEPFTQLLRATDQAFRRRLTTRDLAGIVPITALEAPGRSRSIVTLELTRDLTATALSFDLVLRGNATWGQSQRTDAVKQRGFKRFADGDDPRRLGIQLRAPDAATLPAGAIIEIEAQLGDAPAVVEVSLSNVVCDPPQPILGWLAAVVVR